jgi:uncharacterized membrane protein YccF (DUF307 family)
MSEAVNTEKSVEKVRQLPFILRVIWFFALGWELAAAWILIAWLLNVTIIGLPLGVWMLNRVPQVLTLKARPGMWEVEGDSRRYREVPQAPWLIRAVYFLLIGWWLSLAWAVIGWLLCVTIIGLPLGVPMLNVLPAVTTLQRG